MVFIRFFHGFFPPSEPLNVSVRGGQQNEGLLFGDLTDYMPYPSGFLQITVTGSRTRNVFLQKTLPFFFPESHTLAIIPGFLGMDILQIPDYPCFPVPPEFCCIRTVNLTWDPYAYHLYLYGKRLLFGDISFRQISCCKQLRQGRHGVYLELPFCLESTQAPLIPSTFEARPNQSYTCYVYGSLHGDTLSLRVIKDAADSRQLTG